MILEEKIKEYSWFHSINLGNGVITPGRFPSHIPPNYTIFPVWYFLENIDVEGLDCLDIGTTDGIVAFSLKQEGARKVVATDRGERETFSLLRDYFKLDIDYIPRSTLDDFDIYNKLIEKGLPVKYDLIILAGVIYHSYDPLKVLMHARKLLKENGIIIVETAYHPGEGAALYLNTECEKYVLEPNTYFMPTPSGLEAMMRFISCNVHATIINTNRLAVVAQACKPDCIEKKSKVLDLIIEKGSHYGPVTYDELQKETEISSISYTGRKGIWSINRDEFKTRFKLQP